MSIFSAAMFLVCGAASEVLVSTDWVAANRGALVVDARGAEAYAAGHIPGALHVDVEQLSETRNNVQGELKPLPELEKALSAAGLDPARRVVVYSGMEKPEDLKTATRLFWILEYLSFPNVSVLDGGFSKWKKEGRPVETGAPRAPARQVGLVLTPRPEVLATRGEVLRSLQDNAQALVDCRSPEEYAGLSKQDFVQRPGHIPGARNMPATDLVDPTANTVSGAVPKILRDTVPNTATRITTYCNTGRDASTGYFAFRLGGYQNIALYDGSMAEWGNQAELNIAGPGKN